MVPTWVDQVLHQQAEAGDDDQQIEQDDDLDQQRHAGHQDLRAEEDAVLQHQQAEDLAHRLVPHRQHQEADQLHRQHDGERQHGHRAGKPERLADVRGDDQREDRPRSAPITSAELGCRISCISRGTLQPPDDAQDQVGQQQPRNSAVRMAIR